MVKHLSQLGFCPWTTKRYAGISREKPFSPPNIIGIEKKDGCVLRDLLQLPVLFSYGSAMAGKGQRPPRRGCDFSFILHKSSLASN